MKLTIGFSPCPNDTFIFDALVNRKIDTEGFEFEADLQDVETLNRWAFEDKLDITKLSFPALFGSLENYLLMDSGSALGKGVGPLLISAGETGVSEVSGKSIAIPGVNTTANLLLGFAYPQATDKKAYLFSEIEDAVLQGKEDLGVIIHENRFTYQSRGLHKVTDLGEVWESRMQVPIPLGGIAISQSIKRSVALKVSELIRRSLEYSFDNYPEVSDYVKEHAQAMEESVMRQHIDLYVNEYSKSLGTDGRHAVETLYGVYRQNQGIASEDALPVFLN